MHLQGLNWLDYAILGVIGLSSLISLIRGFVREALSLASWIIAFWVGLTFSSNLATQLQGYISDNTIRTGAAFFLLFIASLFLGAMVNFLIAAVVDRTGLSGTDRMLGVIFGFGRGVLFVALLLLFSQLTTLPKEHIWQDSKLVPAFQPVEAWLHDLLPEEAQNQLTRIQKLPDERVALDQDNQALASANLPDN